MKKQARRFTGSFVFSLFICGTLVSEHAYALRLKDVASLKGFRDNQLMGYGLVVGLAGTGDTRHSLTQETLRLLIGGLGVDIKDSKVESRNAAAVMVTAKISSFSSSGTRMDVNVSALGNARSLEGGTLIVTPLKGADGKVYGIAQGRLVTNMRTGRGTKFLRQSLVTGRIPGGATLEREVKFEFRTKRQLHYSLHHPDFTTAARISRSINEELGARWAKALDAGTVEINFPEGYIGDAVGVVARVENMPVRTDGRSRIVINQRTGTVIMGQGVEIAPSAIAHNNLRIEVAQPAPPEEEGAATPEADNENPLGARVPRDLSSVGRDLDAPSSRGSVIHSEGGTTVADLASTLNALGASPDDLILILQSLQAAGALYAEVITQ